MVNWIVFLLLKYAVCLPLLTGPDERFEYLGEEVDELEDEEDFFNVEDLPQFISTPSYLMIEEGSTAKFTCSVKGLHNPTISWRKVEFNETDSVYIAVGSTLLSTDPRIQVLSRSFSSSLQILLVQDKDVADYQCQVFSHPPIYQTHSIKIKKPWRVEIVGKPESGVIVLPEGQELPLICQGSGNPQPQVYWRRKARHLVDGSMRLYGDQLIYTSVTRHHSGVYVCGAEDGEGLLVEDSVHVQVHYKPEVSIEVNYIHQRDNSRLQIICHAKGVPAPLVDWAGLPSKYKQNKSVHSNTRKGLSVLVIEDNSLVKTGNISCTGRNYLGISKAHFHQDVLET